MANIEQRGDNSYRFTVYLPKDAKGKYPRVKKTLTVEGKYTPKQLREHLDAEYLKFKNEVLSANYVQPQKMTVSMFAIEWEKKYASTLAATTYGNHTRKLKDHILPVIGHIEMSKVNEMVLVDLLSNLKRKDGTDVELSYYSKVDIYKTLQRFFAIAFEWRVIEYNPMINVKKPKKKDDDITTDDLQVYDENEVTQLMTLLHSSTIENHWRVMFTLALATGMRRSELLGLEWSCVDLENRLIEIKKTVVLTKNGAHIKVPKSKTSRRTISLPESIVRELKSYRIEWIKNKLTLGDNWTENEHEWVFCNETGKHFYPSSPSNKWSKFLKNNNFRYIRLHDLRHTSASLLIAQGVHAKIISERLGHSDISITMNTYGHAFKDADRIAADKLDTLFKTK